MRRWEDSSPEEMRRWVEMRRGRRSETRRMSKTVRT